MKIHCRLNHLANVVIFTFFIASQGAGATAPDVTQSALARGEWVARAADCAACHNGSGPGASAFSGGKSIATPMGNIIASNITPSEQYGIGRYTEAQFRQAVTQGIRADGSHLYPAMPYTAYQGMSDADLHALWVWFSTSVPAVNKPVPETALSFPWSVRPLMGIWNVFNNTPPRAMAPLDTPEKQRGFYLTDVLGHCSACHSPRNFTQGESSSARYSGGHQAGWYAPNITSDKVSGIGGWSEQELVQYLKTGNVPGKGTASGGMGEVVEHSLSHLDDDDLHAIASWLQHIPPVRDKGETQAAWQYSSSTTSVSNKASGEKLYQSACAACHRESGQGAYQNRFPSLSHNTTTGSTDPSNLVMVILDGVHRQGNFVQTSMPAFRDALNDQQIAEIASYVTAHYGNAETQVSPKFVAQQREGGKRPLLLTLMNGAPWLILAAVVLLAALWLLRRRRSRRHSRR